MSVPCISIMSALSPSLKKEVWSYLKVDPYIQRLHTKTCNMFPLSSPERLKSFRRLPNLFGGLLLPSHSVLSGLS